MDWVAVAILLVALLCLGTWPACFACNERRGRVPAHTYIDYACAFVVTAVVCALALGNKEFISQLSEKNGAAALWAACGGVLLMLGNMSLQYGVALVGLAVCLPVQASLTVIIGTTCNYLLDGGLNTPIPLFSGVVCFIAAIALGCLAHLAAANKRHEEPTVRHDRNNHRSPANDQCDDSPSMKREVSLPLLFALELRTHGEEQKTEFEQAMELPCAIELPARSQPLQIDSQHQSVLEGGINALPGRSPMFGLAVAAVGGLCFGFFSPAFNLATNDQLNLLPDGVAPLTVYTAYFYFSLAFWGVALAVNVCQLYRPPFSGAKSSVMAFMHDHEGRPMAILAGFISGLGNGLQFVGGQAAGYAAADLVQAYPLVSTLWGILCFGEFRRAPRRANMLLASMYIAYGIAVVLLAISARPRPSD